MAEDNGHAVEVKAIRPGDELKDHGEWLDVVHVEPVAFGDAQGGRTKHLIVCDSGEEGAPARVFLGESLAQRRVRPAPPVKPTISR